MILSILVAMDERSGIGLQNRMPWHLSTDLKRFKTLTMGHHLLLGRKTYEAIRRNLPGRTMVVVTHKRDYQPEGCFVVNSLQAGLDLAELRGESELFVIGGGQIFAQTIDLVDRIYLTLVHTQASCDVFFPKIDDQDWLETDVSHHGADGHNDFPFTFKTLVRKS